MSYLFPGLGYLAIVFSAVGLIQASKRAGRGRILAIGGLTLGVVFTALNAIALYG